MVAEGLGYFRASRKDFTVGVLGQVVVAAKAIASPHQSNEQLLGHFRVL